MRARPVCFLRTQGVGQRQPASSATAVKDRRCSQAKAGVHSSAEPNTSVCLMQAQAAQEAMDGARIGNSDKPIAVQVSHDMPYPSPPRLGVCQRYATLEAVATVAQSWCSRGSSATAHCRM